MELAETLFSTPDMAAVFSGQTHVRYMLAFEAALALVEARVGVIPEVAADDIAACCRIEKFDVRQLYADALPAGTLAIPLVRRLTDLVEGEGRKFVHWGATSQDAVDTALVLQMRDALKLLETRLRELGTACAQLVPVVLGAMAQEHERAVGGWQAEWAAVPELLRFADGALERVRTAVQGLEIYPDRMRANFQEGGGLLMAEALSTALAARLGKDQAHRLVQAVSRRVAEGTDLRRAALADSQVRAVLEPSAIESALDPNMYLGSTNTFIDRALQAFNASADQRRV